MCKINSYNSPLSADGVAEYIGLYVQTDYVKVKVDVSAYEDEDFYISDIYYDDNEDEFYLDIEDSRKKSMDADIIKESIEETLEELDDINDGRRGDDIYVMYKGKKYDLNRFDKYQTLIVG